MAPGNPHTDAHTEHGTHCGALDHHGCGLLARLGEGAGFVGLYLERKPSMPTRMRDGSGALHPDGLSVLHCAGDDGPPVIVAGADPGMWRRSSRAPRICSH